MLCPRPVSRWRLAIAGLVLATAGLGPAEAARRALVVGNDNYQNASKLRNGRNDAQAITAELKRAGFAVTTVLDGTRTSLNSELDGFLARVEKGDEVVFYFSGHGSQPPNMGPYLLPIDIQVSGERSIMRDGLSLEQLVTDLNQRARFSLLILDACRDDPFRQTTGGKSLPPGSALARIEPPKGSMIIMAASKGQQALDRLSNNDPVPNGLFTRELLKHMRTPGLSAGEMLKRVRAGVEQAAASVNHQQRPSLVDEASSDFFFYPGSAAAGSSLGASPSEPAHLTLSMPSPAPPSATRPAPATSPGPAMATGPASGARLAPLPGTSRPLMLRPATPPAQSSVVLSIADFKDWQQALKSPSPTAFAAYLSARPNGIWAAAARVWAELTSLQMANDPQAKAVRAAAAQPGATILRGGAVYRQVSSGEGPAPLPQQAVVVRWRGTRIDGSEFDRSGVPPRDVQELSIKSVVNCWQEALLVMSPGAKAHVTCPAATAYGPQGNPSTMIFDIELLKVVVR